MEVSVVGNMFVLNHEGERIGRLVRNEHEDYIDLVFIGVVEEYRGTRAKNHLLDAIMKMSDDTNKKLICTCSWSQRWFEKHHPEYLKEQ